MTSLSGSSEPSGASRITDRAVRWLLRARSSMSIGEPERQITRVPRKSSTLARRSSSISTLSRSASTTITGLRRLSLAMVSSRTIVKIESDQPRITVWSFSSTIERPRRSSASLVSMPAAITPISALTMNRPPIVSTSIVSRKRHCPAPSPATVPGSSAWKRLSISSRPKPLSSPPPRSRKTVTTTVKKRIRTRVATHSQAISAGRPPRHAVVEAVAQPVTEPRLRGRRRPVRGRCLAPRSGHRLRGPLSQLLTGPCHEFLSRAAFALGSMLPQDGRADTAFRRVPRTTARIAVSRCRPWTSPGPAWPSPPASSPRA